MMLALETTEQFGSVALLDGVSLLEEIRLPHDRRSAQTLAPTIDTLLKRHSVEPGNITRVAVILGPGSFTGLRVGVATAKMFAYAVGAEIVGVKTHDVIAEAFAEVFVEKEQGTKYLSVGVDAQRGEAVVRDFEFFADGRHEPVGPPELIPVSEWWKKAERQEKTLFAGPALERWHAKAPEDALLADKCFWTPQASVAGRIAAKRIRAGESDDLGTLVPVYSRLSAAEERRSGIGG